MTNKAERLQKILAQCGLASRREAERHIKLGDVTINGKVAQLGDKAVLGKDHIKLNGKLVQSTGLNETVALVLFKPRGVLPQPNQEGHKPTPSIYDLISQLKGKFIPVGRLDTDSEGALLLTNNGTLAQRLTQSRYEVPKVYKIKVDGHIDEKKLRRIRNGLKLEGRKIRVEEVKMIRQTEGKSWLRLTTTESQNRIVRKIFEHLAHPIDKISREKYAEIGLRGLKRGDCRVLTENELRKLKEWVGLKS